MTLGALGDISFYVSDKTALTINNLVWGGSARHATHQRHGYHAMTEFTGLDADSISFDIIASKDLGVDPLEIISKVFEYERAGKTLPFVLGNKPYGKYRWVIKKHAIKTRHFDKDGNTTFCVISVDLQEYINW